MINADTKGFTGSGRMLCNREGFAIFVFSDEAIIESFLGKTSVDTGVVG